jgi:D-proline reductase (dithiol) PrdB
MASFDELSFKYRALVALYPWRRLDPVPWTPLRVPLAEARVALVTSAGLYRPGVDAPFTEVRGGDASFRVLPDDVAPDALALGQTSDAFDPTPVLADRNLAYPLDRLRELVDAGVIGAMAPRHVSFNGSITAPARLVRDTVPAIADVLARDAVDAALLVPI